MNEERIRAGGAIRIKSGEAMEVFDGRWRRVKDVVRQKCAECGEERVSYVVEPEEASDAEVAQPTEA